MWADIDDDLTKRVLKLVAANPRQYAHFKQACNKLVEAGLDAVEGEALLLEKDFSGGLPPKKTK